MRLSRKWMNEEFVDLSHVSDGEYAKTMNAFGLNVEAAADSTVEFEIAANRPDCCSMIGLARESAAAFGLEMRRHDPEVRGWDGASIFEMLDAEVYAEDLCSRYTARMAVNVRVAPSPGWLCRRLRACGIEPVNNITDIANYVMLEYGQPLQVFDHRDITSGTLVVREAMDGETLTTADGVERPLTAGMPVVCDCFRIIGLAGIMGGENTGLREDTTAVIFGAANYDVDTIRQTALELGMTTAASERFEKHLDPMLTVPAVQRACELVEMLGAGDVLEGTIDVLNYVPQPETLPLEPETINRLLGTNLSGEQMVQYLHFLEIPVENDTILIPSFRPDLKDTADIAAEVGRLLRTSAPGR